VIGSTDCKISPFPRLAWQGKDWDVLGQNIYNSVKVCRSVPSASADKNASRPYKAC
jgi:hypothetical protein